MQVEQLQRCKGWLFLSSSWKENAQLHNFPHFSQLVLKSGHLFTPYKQPLLHPAPRTAPFQCRQASPSQSQTWQGPEKKKVKFMIGEPQNKKRPGQLTTFHLQRSLGSWKEIRSMLSLAGAGEQRSPIPKHDSLGGAVAPVAEDTHTNPVVRWSAPERRRQHGKLDDHKKNTTFS